MKKTAVILIALILCMTMLFPVFASAETKVQKAIADAASMTWDELLAKAKEEIGGNELHIYGTTSRVNEETFTEKTGIKIVATNPNDSQIYELMENEIGQGIYGPDVVLTQDSFMLVNNAIANGWLENYVPTEFKGISLNPTSIRWYVRTITVSSSTTTADRRI